MMIALLIVIGKALLYVIAFIGFALIIDVLPSWVLAAGLLFGASIPLAVTIAIGKLSGTSTYLSSGDLVLFGVAALPILLALPLVVLLTKAPAADADRVRVNRTDEPRVQDYERGGRWPMTTERKIACLRGSEYLINLVILGVIFVMDASRPLLWGVLIAAACNITAHTIARRRLTAKASSAANSSADRRDVRVLTSRGAQNGCT
jgi:hypothetical protein